MSTHICATANRSTHPSCSLTLSLTSSVDTSAQKGVTVIVSAGNDSIDMKGDFNGHFVRFTGDCVHTIEISATGPQGWACDGCDGTQDFYTPASYSNFGQVDFSGPGGSYDYFFVDPDQLCTVAGIVMPCYVFDYSFSTGNGGWYWSAGTSMSSPAAAGVAALIISENPKIKMKPAQVRAEMAKRALQEGKNGHDDFYGKGFVHSGYYLD